jgi:tRNA threonylcarbamoyl adenosine modification protein YeaZ
MRILAIASASGGCAAALVSGGENLARARLAAENGMGDQIAPMLAALLEKSGPADAVAVVVGPGSFTGLRAGIAVATGIALAAGIELVGVTVTEALAAALPDIGNRAMWVATHARRGHVLLDRGDGPAPFPLNALPKPSGPVAIAGDASNDVAAALAARGADTLLSSAHHAQPDHVASVAIRRLRGELRPCPAVPLYVEPPRVTTSPARLPPGP